MTKKQGMNLLINMWKSSGIGRKMTVLILTLFLASIIITTSIVFNVFSDTYEQGIQDRLNATGEATTQSFMDWLEARQDEVRYIASLDMVEDINEERIGYLLHQLSESHGFYDTIYFVNPDGVGVAGVTYDFGTRILSADEASEFQVADREWFQQAIKGEDTFSKPLVSRSTGNQISNVVIPVRRAGDIVGVVRAAVKLETLSNTLDELEYDEATEMYLINQEGLAITHAPSIKTPGQPIRTEAARAAQNGADGVGIYENAAGVSVVGSYHFIPLLGWTMVVETREDFAMAEVNSVFWNMTWITLVILSVVGVIIVLMVRYNITYPLDKTIQQLTAASDQVASASEQVSSSSQSLAEGSSQQAANLEETSSSLEEIAAQTKQNADNANQANRAVKETSNVIDGGVTSMERMSEAIETIKNSTNETSKIIKTIDEIAFQTNLLALNAAVEAARAGEAGKGFAVVAEEVRNLAQRSAEAARNTSHLIEESQENAGHGVNVAKEVGEQLSSIQKSSVTIETLISEIAAASNEQTHGIGQVNQAVSEMDKVVQSNAANSEETASASEELSSLGAELKRMIGGLAAMVGGNNNDEYRQFEETEIRFKLKQNPLRKLGGRLKNGNGHSEKKMEPAGNNSGSEEEFLDF